jgi:hypothetical protein
MDLEHELRDAFARDAAQLEVSGVGAPEVRRRGRRRHNRRRAGVVAIAAGGLVGATVVAVANRPESKASVAVQPRAPQPEVKLDWRVVDGTLAYDTGGVTVSDGVLYAISTAPGTNNATTQRTSVLYSTEDGEHWKTVGDAEGLNSLESDDGVLYALSTAPGTAVDQYQLRTSSDGGSQWSTADIPISVTTPEADVALTRSSSAQVAHGAGTTVVVVSTRFDLDYDAISSGGAFKAHQTAAGVEIVDLSGCDWLSKQETTATTEPPASPETSRAGMGVDCPEAKTEVKPWSDYGVTDPAALNQQQILMQRDGDWQTVDSPVPAGSYVQDVEATSDGFVIVAQAEGRRGTQVYASSDGSQWETRSTLPDGMYVQSAAGDLLIATNLDSQQVMVSSDAARTWSTVDFATLLPGGYAPAYSMTAAGPLGFAIVTAGSDTGPNHLLHSSDGAHWTVTNLTEQGAPNNSPQTLRVGADHIDVGYWSRPSPDAPVKGVALIATPER